MRAEWPDAMFLFSWMAMIYRPDNHGKPHNQVAAQGYDAARLPAGVRSRMVACANGLNMHVLEAGFESPNRPCIVLLHGFPELAYSWRKLMPILAAAGYHVIAPDQRGYGRTSGSDDRYDGDLAAFHLLNLADDVRGLLTALE